MLLKTLVSFTFFPQHDVTIKCVLQWLTTADIYGGICNNTPLPLNKKEISKIFSEERDAMYFIQQKNKQLRIAGCKSTVKYFF